MASGRRRKPGEVPESESGGQDTEGGVGHNQSVEAQVAEYEDGGGESGGGDEIPEDDDRVGAQRIQETHGGVLRIRASIQQADGDMDGPGLGTGRGHGRRPMRATVQPRGVDPSRNVETQKSNSSGKQPGDARPRATRVEAAGAASAAQGAGRAGTEVKHAADGRRFRQSNAASEHKPGVREASSRKDFF